MSVLLRFMSPYSQTDECQCFEETCFGVVILLRNVRTHVVRQGSYGEDVFLESSRVWVVTWKTTERTWVSGRRGLHGLRGQHGIIQKEMGGCYFAKGL
jgi:hypothetical protein